MTLRLLQTLVPVSSADEINELLAGLDLIDIWQEPVHGERLMVRILVEADKTEPVLDALEQRFAHQAGFRVALLAVEATLPRPEEPEEKPVDETAPVEKKITRHVSREELLTALEGGSRIGRTYVSMVVLSAIVAAVGLMRDSVAVIIGAMVIAPLLTPNIALALATTLGDLKRVRRSLRTNLAGLALAFLLALGMGLLLPFDPTVPEITSRTMASVGDVIVALAAGCAGTLAFTTGVSASLVGVMVAVALMPPLVAAGLLFGTGLPAPAWRALLLLFTNVICVNLAAVVTFLVKGVRPRTWWEADKARRSARRAVLLWTALLAIFVLLMAVLHR